ncbi:DMT family transporter [Neisseria shayeganii]|uniref:DMT family transporter n=1 Tax=Neisseria shayeganii TaxID=607712 RepID=A0A7D7RMP6_9NEIS|nr:DMT family transporter [Neisseria shayeganii]QMT40382.1 DMT family transporter [Neisseria shayeganii]
MNKNNLLLLATIFLWGTVWYAIKFQLGDTPIAVSIFYRILLAALVLLAWCAASCKIPRLSIKDHAYLALMGLLLFSSNYYCFYLATGHIKSGLVSVVFSTLVLVNSLNKRLFFREPISKAVVLGGMVGIIGVALLFSGELKAAHDVSALGAGIFYALLGTYMVSAGNMLSARFSKHNLPVLASTALGLSYGAVLCAVLIVWQGDSFRIPLTIPYLSSLLYLSLFCTALAFWLYLTLVKNSGPDKAALATILFPLVAMLVSSVLEDYVWSAPAVLGGVLILVGYSISLFFDRHKQAT